MAITVGDIYTAFSTFKPKDMIKLVGNDKFNGRTQISLNRIASYKGGMAQELSVFTAKKEGKAYTNKLSETERQKLSEKSDINVAQNKPQENIPMDKSVFDIDRQLS